VNFEDAPYIAAIFTMAWIMIVLYLAAKVSIDCAVKVGGRPPAGVRAPGHAELRHHRLPNQQEVQAVDL
jgi:hypothetical protein